MKHVTVKNIFKKLKNQEVHKGFFTAVVLSGVNHQKVMMPNLMIPKQLVMVGRKKPLFYRKNTLIEQIRKVLDNFPPVQSEHITF